MPVPPSISLTTRSNIEHPQEPRTGILEWFLEPLDEPGPVEHSALRSRKTCLRSPR